MTEQTMYPMRLLIGIPSYDSMHYSFVESLVNLTRKLDRDGVDFDVFIKGATLVYLSRDEIVRHACVGEYTHILWLDDDIVFDDGIFDRLNSHGEDFVSGICVSRHVENGSCLFSDLKGRKRYTEYPSGLFPIEACGFACVLMRTTLARTIINHHGTCFMPFPEFGEDLAFCQRLNEFGYSMYADSDVRVGHIARSVVYPNEKPKLL